MNYPISSLAAWNTKAETLHTDIKHQNGTYVESMIGSSHSLSLGCLAGLADSSPQCSAWCNKAHELMINEGLPLSSASMSPS